MNGTQTGTTILGQNGPKNNGNDRKGAPTSPELTT